jgi:NADH:ubiquinone oxidoreductase subunit 2 (subunit N)
VGFFTKYFIFLSSVGTGEGPLVILAAMCAVVSAYAYLRPIGLMVMRDADPGAANWEGGFWSQLVVIASVIMVVFLGLMPNAMIQYLKGIPLIH